MSGEETEVRCACANDGNACRCPHHTQADYDASTGTSEGVEAAVSEASDWWCLDAGEPRQVACCTACVSSLSALLNEFYNSDDGECVSALGDIHRHVAAREAAARAEAWEAAAELADTQIVLWSEVPGLHPTAPEPHPAAIAASGARRTLVVLRSRMSEAFEEFAARIAREV